MYNARSFTSTLISTLHPPLISRHFLPYSHHSSTLILTLAPPSIISPHVNPHSRVSLPLILTPLLTHLIHSESRFISILTLRLFLFSFPASFLSHLTPSHRHSRSSFLLLLLRHSSPRYKFWTRCQMEVFGGVNPS